MNAKYAYEDFHKGRVFNLGPKTVTAAEIIAFAKEYDPQPFHMDEEAGKKSILGGLAASGWHTCSMLMRMMCDAYMLDTTSQGAPGVEFTNWKHPVLAGDTLTGTTTIISGRLLNSRPGLGIVTLLHILKNQDDVTVCEVQHKLILKQRAAAQMDAQQGAAS